MDPVVVAALVGAAVSVVTFAAGLLLRPWLDRKLRRQERAENWTKRLQDLSADLRGFLFRGFTRYTVQAQHAAAYVEWEGGLQRELVHAASFAPDEKQRDACDKVWREFEKLIRRVYALDHVPADSPRLEDAKQRYEEAFGETSYSLDELVEQLGGPKTIPRDSYTLELRGEGDDGLKDLD